jgi:UDP:flavonoid glycosyltransferase YjiC (YdhE family)
MFCVVSNAAHPNVRLFITHGGLLSTQETLNRGVPVVGIPIMADQKLNLFHIYSAGCGIQLDFANVTTQSLEWALKEVLENPRYRLCDTFYNYIRNTRHIPHKGFYRLYIN